MQDKIKKQYNQLLEAPVRPPLQERRRMSEANHSLSKCGDIRAHIHIAPELTVVPLSENDINKKVITKAVAWGMKVFGDFAPTDGQEVIDTMMETGLNEFNSVARIANINKRKVR